MKNFTILIMESHRIKGQNLKKTKTFKSEIQAKNFVNKFNLKHNNFEKALPEKYLYARIKL